MISDLMTSCRIAGASILVCVVAYGTAVLGGAAAIAPHSRQGQLVSVDGRVVGSRLVGQAFTRPEYVWPRPSAVAFAANASGGSNLSPANPAIRERAEEILAGLGASAANPAPADLVLASGSGLDPHISESGAIFQAARVAGARDVSTDEIRALIAGVAEAVGPAETGRIVNCLTINMELDRRFPMP